MPTEPPNVLFIMDDQHNARCLGCYGNDDVETPTLDRLANRGTRFSHAYCQSPICSPSRVAYLTGRYPHSIGMYGNYGTLPAQPQSIAYHLRDHGYDTGGFGKLHIPVEWPTNGFDTRRVCDFADVEHDIAENHYYSYLEQVGYAADYDLGPASNSFPHTAFVSNIPAEHSVERWTANETLRWLRRRDRSSPFFAWMSFQRPHPPYAPPPEYADRYDPESLELPPIEDSFDDKPSEWQTQAESSLYQRTDRSDLRQVLAYYYSLITLIDEQINRVIEHLDTNGDLSNTIVIFCSDHGDFAGEHGFMRKNVCIPEAIHRVPLIWQFPDTIQEGAVVDELVQTIDVVPTLCELLDIPIPQQTQGDSFAPALRGEPYSGREAVYCENQDYRTIRTEEWKLTYCLGRQEGELYHIADDPWEQTNLYADPEYGVIKTRLLEQLLDFYAETEEPILPAGSSAPRDETPAHRVWTRRWWDHDGTVNSSPLDHLGGPGPKSDEQSGN